MPSDSIHSVHLLVEFWGCKAKTLNDHELIVTSLEKAARLSNGTVLDVSSHQFTPQGVTAIVLLSESHISIHTWPELEYAAIDVFTCGKKMDPHKAVKVLEEMLHPSIAEVQEIIRGVKKL
jgi:S-adenosylmethionine decarboxylase